MSISIKVPWYYHLITVPPQYFSKTVSTYFAKEFSKNDVLMIENPFLILSKQTKIANYLSDTRSLMN